MTRLPCLVLGYILLASTSAVFADIIETKIGAPQDVPDYLRVESKAAPDGMLEFVIRVNPDKAAHVEGDSLYKGRVSVTGSLHLATEKATIAQVLVEANRDIYGRHRGDPVRARDDRSVKEKDDPQRNYRFKVASELAKHSKFHLSTHLHEKDGHPTLGGGVLYEISLAAFVPARAPKETKADPRENRK
jgi:hypothetical protein